ncbi:MAG: NAD-binding protein [Natronomonas sp.]|uniref:potassium channel family protein n=1 Tax=Natronomonas sp. TaxID=2184060 RepID=UPI00286FFF88|nr:NAD-binding protein [Natronomonas sp.]MDR9430701.1 NAD-binding protein [Natronomonas sp.]
MSRVKRRAVYYVAFIAVLILVAAAAYDFGMRTFEPGPYPPPGTEISLLHSMQVVVETFTATGYGSDSPWQSVQMNLLVMLLDVTGVGLFFLALPAVLLPLFKDALSPSVPTEIDATVDDHVIVCSDTSRAEALIDELDANGLDHVFIDPDRDRSMDLAADGYRVINGDPESTEALERAHIADARALVADVSDRVDASIVLAAEEATGDSTVISVVEDAETATYHRLAGADHVLTPRRVLGDGLAGKLTTGVRTDLGEAVRVGDDFEIVELPIHRNGSLVGRTIADSSLRETYGVNVIGAWSYGEFETPPPLDQPLDSSTVLLLAGGSEGIERLRTAERSTVRRPNRGETIVAGYGEVGQTVAAALSRAGVPHTTVDIRDFDGVDVVGDVTDPDVLESAGIERAASIVLALSDDTLTEFATLVVRDRAPDVEVIARADRTDAVRKTYRAGADYVLSLATVSGRSIASRIIDDEEIMSMDTNVQLVRTTAPALDGEIIENAGIRERTGCTVVAIERNGTVHTDLDGAFRLDPGDELVIAGTDAATNRFVERYC